MNEVRLRREAETEFLEALAWYESREPGLGRKLMEEADRTIAAIAERPRSFQTIPVKRPRGRPPLRRALLEGFPYAFVFFQRGRSIRVIAFAHGSRAPMYWLRRIARAPRSPKRQA